MLHLFLTAECIGVMHPFIFERVPLQT